MGSHVAGGGGPYTLKTYNAGVSVVLERNPGHFGPRPKSDTVRVNFVGSDVTLALQARSGQADVTIGMSKQSAVGLKNVGGLRLITAPTSGDQRVVMIHSQKPFDNKLVREAMTYAIPYKDVLAKVNFGYGQLFYGPWAPTVPGADTKLLKPRTYDLAKARALLQRSGVKLPVSLKLAVQNDNATEQQIATVVQSEWKKLGFNVEFVQLSAADMVTAAGKRSYPLMIQVNAPGVWSPLYSYGYDLTCGNAFNTSNRCNKASDAIARKASLEPNAAKRRALLNRLIKLHHADSPYISLYNDVALIVLGSKVKSFTASLYTMDVRNWG
jgi:peptide/nickel transport system substrate-binding protein